MLGTARIHHLFCAWHPCKPDALNKDQSWGGSTVFLGLEGAIGSGSVHALTPNLSEEMEAAWPEMLSCGLNTAAAWSVLLWSWPGTLTPGWHTWWLLLSGSLGLSKKGWEEKVLSFGASLDSYLRFFKEYFQLHLVNKNAFSISVGSQPSLVPPVEVSEGFCVPSNVERVLALQSVGCWPTLHAAALPCGNGWWAET